MRNAISDNDVSRKGLIEFYENLLNNKRIKAGGAATIRLENLKIRRNQRFNKYWLLQQPKTTAYALRIAREKTDEFNNDKIQ